MNNLTKNKRYRVHVEGELIIESDVYFSSLTKAKIYMKNNYSFYIKMDVFLFTLIDEHKHEGINTITTIVNL